MSIVVQKFGGTSVGDVERIRKVARIIADTHDQGHQVAVVISAMGHTTDELVSLAGELVGNPAGREFDALLITGEMVSASLMALTLNNMGYKAVSLNGQQAGFHTEDLHNRARILEIDTGRVQYHLNNGEIVIVTGFQGINSKGDFTTLGRGGSDTSAVALAGALGAERCDIFTDVRGVYSTDPRVVPQAVKVDEITYIEMMELARVGAQVLHPRAVETARHANVQIRVRSTFYTDDMGTLVADAIESSNRPVSGIAADENQVRIAVAGVPDHPGVAAKIFGSLASKNISIDMIIQSLSKENANDIAFTISTNDLHDALETMEKIKSEIGATEVLHDTDVSKVSIVGIGMIDRPGIAADMFAALAEAKVNIKMIATSEIKISCLIDKNQAKRAVQAMHKIFFPEAEEVTAIADQKTGY
jgi:aspartate kinase